MRHEITCEIHNADFSDAHVICSTVKISLDEGWH